MKSENLSVCIDSVFQGRPVSEALKSVKETGYSSYEFWSWWDKDIAQLSEFQLEHGLNAAAFCTKFISLTDASMRTQYLQGLAESLEAAKLLDCHVLISQVGNALPEKCKAAQHKSIVEGLKECAGMLEDSNVILAIEPLNIEKDHKGYYLPFAREAFEIIDEVASPNVKVLYDLYHQQITGDFSAADIVENIDKIAHFHSAGIPGRDELSIKDFDKKIFESIYTAGYKGHIGLEYFPAHSPEEGLKEVYGRYSD